MKNKLFLVSALVVLLLTVSISAFDGTMNDDKMPVVSVDKQNLNLQMILLKDNKMSDKTTIESKNDVIGNDMIVYKDIYGTGSTVSYIDDGHKIKEEIRILKHPQYDGFHFVISHKIDGLDMTYFITRSGQIRFFDGTGPTFMIDRSFVIDSEGNKLYLTPDYDGLTYTVRIPKTYLDNAVYPITIDPTVIYDIPNSAINYSLWNYTFYSSSLNPPSFLAVEDTLTTYFGMTTQTSVSGTSTNILTAKPSQLQLQNMDKVIDKVYYSKDVDFALNEFYLLCSHNEVSSTTVSMQLSLSDGTNRVVFYNDVKTCNGLDGSNNNATTVSNLHLKIYRNNTFCAYDDSSKFNTVLSTATLDKSKNWTVLYNATLNTLATNNEHSSHVEYGNITYNATSWCTPSSTACLSDGQVAEYFFNSYSGNTTPDTKHLEQDMNLKAASGDVPLVDGNITFSGSNYGNASWVWDWINLSKQGAVEIKFLMNTVTPQYQAIMDCRGSASSYFHVYGNYAYLTVGLGAGTLLSAGHTLTPNTPTHIVVNYDNGDMVIYVNGVNTINDSYTPSSEKIPSCVFGGSYAVSNFMNGSIDYVRIYDRELLDWEVERHYTEGEGYDVTGINISILYEANSTPYLKDATVRLLTDYTDQTFITNTGLLTIPTVDGASYTVRVYGEDTGIRTYEITTTSNVSYNLIVLLPLNSSTALFTVRDALSSIVLENALVTVSTIVNSTEYVVSSGYTDVMGRFEFSFNSDTRYTFVVTKQGYLPKQFILNRVESSSYEVPIFPSSGGGVPANYQDVSIQVLSDRLEYNQNNSINISFASPLERFHSYSVTVDYPGGSLTQSGNDPSGEILFNYFNITGGDAMSVVNVSYSFIDEYGYIFNYTQSFGITGYTNVNGTLSTMIHTDYGMGVLEKVLIAVLLTLILTGAAGTVMGSPGAIIGALTGYLFFFYIAFIPLWSILVIIPFAFVLLVART